jgi:hypothetical protein
VTNPYAVDRPSSEAPALNDAPHLDPSSAALAGLAGDVVRALEPHTEADPAALLVNVLVHFGAMVGSGATTRVGAAVHVPAFFAAIVGRTSRSRKGTADAEVSAMMERVEDGWHRGHRVGGFGSGEAFIEHCAENPGSSVLMVEPEFARLLAVASREGSSASSVLRSAWDHRPMDYRIRKTKYEAPAAPIALLAQITADELRDRRHGIRLNDVMNGFGNRVLWAYADRRKVLANPTHLDYLTESGLVIRLRDVLSIARGTGEVIRTSAAQKLWADLYERLAADDPPGTIGAVTGRAEAQLTRLSLVYALLDGSSAMWRYSRWSAQHIWVGAGTGDPDLDRIESVLAAGEELTARELDRMFLGHRSTAELRQKAIEAGIAVELKEGTAGRPRTLLRAADKAEKADKPSVRWWIAPTFTGSSASSADRYESAEPGYRQVQREAGEEPETDEALAFLRLQRVVDELRQEAAGGS